MSFTCMSLATIDQFLAICAHPRFARWVVIGALMMWICHGIPFLVYFDHIRSPSTGRISCSITNIIFQKYVTYFHLLVLGIFVPITIMMVFGILAYRNVQRIAYRTVPLIRRELDKQLTVIVLVQVLCDVVFATPFIMQVLCGYFLVIPTDLYSQAILRMLTNIGYIWFYFRYAVSLLVCR